MNQSSRISLCNLFLKYPFRRSSRPTCTFSSDSFPTISNRCVSDTVLFPNPKIFSPPISKFHSFPHPICLNPWNKFSNHENLRNFSGESVPDFDQTKEVDEINLKFAEAREEIEMASESKETVYFDEEAECARAAVKEVLDMFEGLLAKLPEKGKAALQRSMGLKIEQLKAELAQLNE
ncbi:hypothetical protein HHK36_007973 [Tetracentron sinense]|uniref:Late embryogenesis abundant protein n=1 Tax=Tetracentron sinense TaxID=13715 RepID=A0A834ZI78_TETSI|nr:hypothetical protein HHK36_007973 [Tetracentron sinense]